MISRGATEADGVAGGLTGLAPVPVKTDVARKLAALTIEVIAGWVGSSSKNAMVAGAWPGLLGGAGLVTAIVHWIGYTVAPLGAARYAMLMVACKTCWLSRVEVTVIGGLEPCCIVTTDVLKKLLP